MAGIFINYRRDDAPGVAGRLADRLAQNFPKRDIFMDVDAMKPGLDFVKQLNEQVANCDVFLAVIGPGWLTATDEKGRRKLDLPGDYVHVELAFALKREIPVVPLLVNGTAMPFENDLPDDLKSLTKRHAVELRHTRFAADSEAIVRALHDILPPRSKWLRVAAIVALVGTCISGGIAWWALPLGHSGSNTSEVSTVKTTMQPVSPSADNRPEKPAASLIESSKPDSTSSTPTSTLTAAPVLASPSAPKPSLAPGDYHGNRIALVIGNSNYSVAEAPLKEPINDARDVADELKRDGFSVDVGENLTGEAMRRAFDKLYGRIKPGSVALIFFSGFGVQSQFNRQSYMIPVDAQIWTEPDVRRDGFSLETVLGEINSRGAGVKIALLDASRRNPFERRFRSFSAGLAPVIAPNGTLVMYSAALSSVVPDNGGDHSLFVQELLKQIRVPDVAAEETLNRTRVGVTRASRGEQVPWISSSLAEDFSFSPNPTARN
jgi:hypothetical protein